MVATALCVVIFLPTGAKMHYTKYNAKEPNKFCQGAKFGSGATGPRSGQEDNHCVLNKYGIHARLQVYNIMVNLPEQQFILKSF